MRTKAEKPGRLGEVSRLSALTGLNWRLSTVLAVAFMATLLSPYISFSGRGLRSTWTIVLVWAIIFAMENSHFISSISSTFRKRRFELSMLSVWLIIVLLNAVLKRGYTGWLHVIATVSLCLIIFVQITYSSLRPEAFRTVVFWTIILLGLDAARSLPVLFSDPGIPRLVMLPGSDPLLRYQAYAAGVGDYELYTANAIAFPVILAAAFSFKGVKRLLLLVSCVCIGLAVTLSTFTAAVSIMVTGIIVFSVLSYRKWQKKFLTGVLILVLVFFVMFGLIYYLRDTAQVSSVISKNIRLFEGITNYGFIMGDETFRASLFMLSLETFRNHLFMGVGPCTLAANPYLYTYVGGHSSWIDQLAEYGVLGFGWFIAFALAGSRRVVRYFIRYKNNLIIRASFVSCVLYFISGVVNPVLFINPISALFFLIVLGSMENAWRRSESLVRTRS